MRSFRGNFARRNQRPLALQSLRGKMRKRPAPRWPLLPSDPQMRAGSHVAIDSWASQSRTHHSHLRRVIDRARTSSRSANLYQPWPTIHGAFYTWIFNAAWRNQHSILRRMPRLRELRTARNFGCGDAGRTTAMANSRGDQNQTRRGNANGQCLPKMPCRSRLPPTEYFQGSGLRFLSPRTPGRGPHRRCYRCSLRPLSCAGCDDVDGVRQRRGHARQRFSTPAPRGWLHESRS